MLRKTEKERETWWAPFSKLPKKILLQGIMRNQVIVLFFQSVRFATSIPHIIRPEHSCTQLVNSRNSLQFVRSNKYLRDERQEGGIRMGTKIKVQWPPQATETWQNRRCFYSTIKFYRNTKPPSQPSHAGPKLSLNDVKFRCSSSKNWGTWSVTGFFYFFFKG